MTERGAPHNVWEVTPRLGSSGRTAWDGPHAAGHAGGDTRLRPSVPAGRPCSRHAQRGRRGRATAVPRGGRGDQGRPPPVGRGRSVTPPCPTWGGLTQGLCGERTPEATTVTVAVAGPCVGPSQRRQNHDTGTTDTLEPLTGVHWGSPPGRPTPRGHAGSSRAPLRAAG